MRSTFLSFDLADTCVFGKQSLGPILCDQVLLFVVYIYNSRYPFSLSYGVILPNSLTKVLPRVLGFSPRLPVSVCGTGISLLDSAFSWQCGIWNFATCFSLLIVSRSFVKADLPTSTSYLLVRALPFARFPYPPASTLLS